MASPLTVLKCVRTATILAVAVALSGGEAHGQPCSGVPVSRHARLVTGVAIDGHAYGTTRGVFASGRPTRRLNAWATSAVTRTSDASVRLRAVGVVLRGEIGVPLPGGVRLCPVGSVGYFRTRGVSAGSLEDWSQFDTDWGAAVGWSRALQPNVRLAASVRGRRGETRLRRRLHGLGGDVQLVDWPYQQLEAFAGVTLNERFVVRPSLTYFRFRSANPLDRPQPLARADGEVGVGLLLGFVF